MPPTAVSSSTHSLKICWKFSSNSSSRRCVTSTSTRNHLENKKMKKILILTITLLSGGLAQPAAAAPCGLHVGHSYTYMSGYLPCGAPIYTKRVVVGFDCRNNPIYRYYRVSGHSSHRSHYLSHTPHRSYQHSRRTYVTPRHYSSRSHYRSPGYSWSTRGGFAVSRH